MRLAWRPGLRQFASIDPPLLGQVDQVEELAPEAVEGGEPDGRVDQYALAVMVYERLAHRFPFDATTPAQFFAAHVMKAPQPLSAVDARFGPAITGVLHRALSKGREERFESCGEFATAVLAALDMAPAPAAAPAQAESSPRGAASDSPSPPPADPPEPPGAQWPREAAPEAAAPTGQAAEKEAPVAATVASSPGGHVLDWLLHRHPGWAWGAGSFVVVFVLLLGGWWAFSSVPGPGSGSVRPLARRSQPQNGRRPQRSEPARAEPSGAVLEPPAPTPPSPAVYAVSLSPPEARLSADGAGVTVEGSGSLRTVRVAEPDGRSQVTLVASLEGYASEERELRPQPDEMERVELRLKPLEPPPLAVAPFSSQQARRHQDAWAEHLGQPRELTNSIGMKLVLIPLGEFMMGSPSSERDRDSDEGPQHRVRITRPFYLSVYEVTQEQYEQVMGINPSSFSRGGSDQVSGMDTSRFPVEAVSSEDAEEFCRRLSVLPAERSAGREYRLPTEAEWEYACRAGTTTRYHFGNDLTSDQARFAQSWSSGRPVPVGSYSANGFGLYDMHGNVWEWCSDWYDEKYYATSPVDDPQGPASGSYRVSRGGDWSNYAGFCRSASRNWHGPDYRPYYFGIRLALVPTDESSK